MRWIQHIRKHHYLILLIEVGILLLLILFIPGPAKSQESNIVKGIVYETESGMPLAGTHVILDGTSYGTISGPDGFFHLNVKRFPANLRLSHVGFEDRLFILDESHRKDTLMLGMSFKAEMLEGVTITDNKIETIFRDETYSVLDFEFHENGLMLLIYRNRIKKSELVLLSFMNDTLAIFPDLPGKALSLHRDCKDYIHYCGQDSAYQVYFNGSSLELIHPVSMNIFKPVADAFVAFHKGYYYFAVSLMHKQMIEYIRYDSISENYASFRRIADERKLRMLKDNPEHNRLLVDPFSDAIEFHVLLSGNLESIKAQRDMRDMERDLSIEGHYLRTIIYTPLYAPMFENDDGLIIFNHPQSVVEFLDEYGKLEFTTDVDYHKSENWDSKILKDEIQDKYYAVFSRMNRLTLRTIDITNGDISQPNTLYYPFVKKVLVRNGYAYFTYRTPGSTERTMLFRQKLVQKDKMTAQSNP